MRFDPPLVPATLLRRYKRFLADVRLADGQEVTVHCPNSGRMTSCAEAGRPVRLAPATRPGRKLPFTWEMIQMEDAWVGVHSARANAIVKEALEAATISELAAYDSIRPEVRHENSRLDFQLGTGDAPCFVEVKHSTMRVGAHAAFPDAVSARGAKHLGVLRHLAQAGHRAVALYVVGRTDCPRFRIADEIDPAYAAAFREAVASGVEVLAYQARFTPEAAELTGRLPVDLAFD